MAKYSVGGTEIIDDSGLIDWNKLKNKPSISGPQAIGRWDGNCSTWGTIGSSLSASTGSVTLTLTASGGEAFACNCNCVCTC